MGPWPRLRQGRGTPGDLDSDPAGVEAKLAHDGAVAARVGSLERHAGEVAGARAEVDEVRLVAEVLQRQDDADPLARNSHQESMQCAVGDPCQCQKQQHHHAPRCETCDDAPGADLFVVDDDGVEVGIPGGGFLAIPHAWPSMLRTVWGDDQRYLDTYWSRFDGMYFPGDGAKRDDDGYFWLLGRVDDIMLIAGHNISTTEVESALVSHPSVAEAAVVGRADPIRQRRNSGQCGP